MGKSLKDAASVAGITENAAQAFLDNYAIPKGMGQTPRAKEIPINSETYARAYSEGMNLSAWLEKEDKTVYNDGLDAYQRQLYLADIRCESNLSRGMLAHDVQRFWEPAHGEPGVLFPEFVRRTWDAASRAGWDNYYGQDGYVRDRFYQSTSPVSDILKPDYIARQIRQKQIAPALPLSEMIAVTTGIDSDTYRGFYLTDSTDDRRMRRVSEGAAIPSAVLTGAERTIRLKKYGRALEATYETIRRLSIDRFALHLQLLAVQAEVDKVLEAIDILLNGDGNSGSTPTNSNLTTLDATAVAGTLTMRGYLSWLVLWQNPYVCTTLLSRSDKAIDVLLLNLGTANWMFYQAQGNFGIGGVRLINQGIQTTPALGYDSSVTANYLLGFDRRFTLEMVQEVGTDIVETDRLIRHQMEEIVVSETIGYFVMDANALRTMNINA